MLPQNVFVDPLKRITISVVSFSDLFFFKCSSKIQLVLNTAKSYMPDERGAEAHLLQAAMVPGKYFASLALLMRVEQNNLLKKSKKQGYKRVAIKSRFP